MSDCTHKWKGFMNSCPELSKECPYCRIAELEKSLREIINYAKPKLRSTRDKLVKDGVCLSGSLMHYEVMPHLITIGKKALNLPENGDE